MKDIVADKIISFLSANNIEYSKYSDSVVIPIKNKESIINVFYINKRFYIDKSDYVGQPHIILHWNPKSKNCKENKDKYGLCLTMDGSDRRDNELTASGMIDRVREIVYELWDDPVGERFRELNTILQTQTSKELYIDENEIITNIKTDRKYENIDQITINFNGQSKLELIDLIEKKFINKWVFVKIKYGDEVKKIVFSNNLIIYKLNDFSNDSFWARTGKNKGKNNAIVIGLGSVGGLVLDNLCRFGFDKITIYDDDEYDVINNPRHILGIKANQIGINKAKFLADHYSKIYPMIDIVPISSRFKYDSIISENTLIFNTTGGSHKTLLSNASSLYLANIKKNFSFIDIFVEPFALAVHSILFEYSAETKKIKFPEKYIRDERYIVTPKKDFRKNFDGCFTPTLPYGFAPLQIAIPWLMTVMRNNNYKGCHYTIPFLSLFKDKKNIINKNLSSEINPYWVGVKIWKK